MRDNMDASTAALEELLKPEQLELLARLIRRCIEETGYGGVEIVIAQGKVQNLKVVISYK